MYKALSPGAVNVSTTSLDDAIDKAHRHGFGGVEFSPDEVADLIEAEGAAAVRSRFDRAGLHPACFGLPVDWRTTDESWKAGLAKLPRQADAAAAIGCLRTATWVLSFSNDRPFRENRQFHLDRFGPIAEILHERGISLGLEFIGPKTLRAQGKHEFIHTMGDMLDLGAEIGPNVGILLDAYHWYTSHGKLADLEALTPAQVVYVHVNDAPLGIPVDEQQDGTRCLPGETGVIDIAGFLGALKRIGYAGPVTPEPFKKELKDLPDDDARLAAIAASMDRIFGLAGL